MLVALKLQLMQMTPDDKLIMAKHNSIYPTEEELKQVQNIVGTTEKALKLVSDEIAEEDQKAIEEESKTEENKEKSGEAVEVKKEESSEEGSKTDESKQDLKKPLLKPNLPSICLNFELYRVCGAKIWQLLKVLILMVPFLV